MLKYLFFYFLLVGFKAFSYINIYPTTFDKSIDKGGNWEEYILYNKTPNSIRYQISLSDDGIKNSMKDWIEFYPRVLTIKPGKSEKVKVYIKSPKSVAAGEYLATLEIKENLVPSLEKSSSKSGVQILTHLKMDIVGFVGNLSPKFQLNNFSIKINKKKLTINGKIKNIGNRRGTVNLILSTGRKKDDYNLGTIRILKNEAIDLSKLTHEVNEENILKKINQYKKLILIDKNSEKKFLEINI